MAWVDQLLVVPAIGVLCEPIWDLPTRIWPALRTVCGTWDRTTIAGAPDKPGKLQLERADGLVLDVDVQNIVCKFGYKLKLSNVGPFPSLEPPDLQPYTELLAMVADTFTALASALGPLGSRMERIGILADCNVTLDELPPGANGFVERLKGVPRGGRMSAATAALTSVLDERDDCLDRCHYTLEAQTLADPRVRLKLDWQRVWSPPRTLTPSDLAQSVRDSVDAALQHFEAFGADELGAGVE